MTIACPDCSTSLLAVDHEGVQTQACPTGHGTWLDRGELQEVTRRETAVRSEAEQQAEVAAAGSPTHFSDVMATITAEQVRACPVCGTAMRKQEYAGTSAVVVDSCAEHGVWLDAGELERVEAFAEGQRRDLARLSGGAPAPSAGMLQHLAGQFGR